MEKCLLYVCLDPDVALNIFPRHRLFLYIWTLTWILSNTHSKIKSVRMPTRFLYRGPSCHSCHFFICLEECFHVVCAVKLELDWSGHVTEWADMERHSRNHMDKIACNFTQQSASLMEGYILAVKIYIKITSRHCVRDRIWWCGQSLQLEIDQSDKMMYLKCQGLCTDVSWMSKYSVMDRMVLREYDIRGQYWKFQRL